MHLEKDIRMGYSFSLWVGVVIAVKIMITWYISASSLVSKTGENIHGGIAGTFLFFMLHLYIVLQVRGDWPLTFKGRKLYFLRLDFSDGADNDGHLPGHTMGRIA